MIILFENVTVQFSSSQKNTKTIAQRLQKCPLTVKSVFEKMRLQMPPPLKQTYPIFSEGRGASVSVTDVFTAWIHVKGGSNRRKNHPFTNKSVYVRKGRNICAFIVCFEQHQLPQLNCFFSAGSFTAKISINAFNGELFSLEVYCLCCVLWLIPDSNGASSRYLCYLQIN